MAKLVGQHQQSSFSSPSNGDRPIDATVVKGNDNSLVTIHNAHDNNATVHVQSGATADKPAAGTVGRMFYDTTIGRLEYDTGSAWVTQNFASGTAAARPAATAVSAGTVYFVTDTGLFSYSDGVTWTTLSPASGPTGSGTTEYLAKWTGGTTLGDSAIFKQTIIGREFWFLNNAATGYGPELLGYTSKSPVRTHQFIRLTGYAATQTSNGHTAVGSDIAYIGNGLSAGAANVTSLIGLRCYQDAVNIPAYLYSQMPASMIATDRVANRQNGIYIRMLGRLTNGAYANQPEFLFVGAHTGSVGPGYLLGTHNVQTLPNANGIHAMGIQLDTVTGEWLLILHDGTNAVYDSYQISTSNAGAIADDEEFEIYFGVDANTTTYRWRIVRSGTLVSESSYNASTMRNPGITTTLNFLGVSINRSSAVTTEYFKVLDLLMGVDVST